MSKTKKQDDVSKLIENIRKWNPYCENITLCTIFAQMKVGNHRFHVISYGSPGSGKSMSTIELVNALRLGNTIVLDNTTTDRGLFDTLLNYNEQNIILDECSTLLKSKGTQDMIKLAMEGKPLTWTKSAMSETTEPYSGNLIINANVPIADAVVDRAYLNRTHMNKKMTISFNKIFVEGINNPPDFSWFINHITRKIKNKTRKSLTNEEIAYAIELIEKSITDNDREQGYSRRIIIRSLTYLTYAKNLFACLDERVMRFIEPFLESYIVNERPPGLIEKILGSSQMPKADVVRTMVREGGYTEQHARRLINRELEEGKLELIGKMLKVKE